MGFSQSLADYIYINEIDEKINEKYCYTEFQLKIPCNYYKELFSGIRIQNN